MNLDQIKSLFGALVAFLIIGLQKYDAKAADAFLNNQIETSDRELFGRVDISAKNGITELITAADIEAKGVRNFNSNKLLPGQHFAFNQIKIAFGNTVDGSLTSTGVIAAPTVYNVYYSCDTFSRNELLKTNRSAVAGAAEAFGVPVQRVPNQLLNASIRLSVGGKPLFYGSVKRIMNAGENSDGYLTLNMPKLMLADQEIILNLEFATGGAAMPANSFLEYSLVGVGIAQKAV